METKITATRRKQIAKHVRAARTLALAKHQGGCLCWAFEDAADNSDITFEERNALLWQMGCTVGHTPFLSGAWDCVNSAQANSACLFWLRHWVETGKAATFEDWRSECSRKNW